MTGGGPPPSRALTLAAPATALVAAAVLAFVPLVSRTSATTLPDGTEVRATGRVALTALHGRGLLALLLVPVAVAALPYALRRTRAARPAAFAASGALLLLAGVAGFSVGPFFVPAALLLFAAGVRR